MRKLFFLFSIASLLFSQNGSITGKVYDNETGKALIGANVIIDGTNQGAASDAEGRFTIKNLPAGKYNLKVSYIGYQNLQLQVSVLGNETVEANLGLDPEAIQMETYVVTASRKRERIEDAPAAISVISKKEIRRESNTNLGDYIKGTKGIDFTQSGIDSYNMTARGFNSSLSSRLLTLMDGRMANVPSLRLTAYNVIPVSFEDVEQIEVVLGPSSALYGPNAHSGVLNIVTSSPLRSQGTSINIQGGLLNQTDTDLLKKLTVRTAHKFGDFGFKISGVALAGQDWKHFNEDEYEGHDPLFIGRPNLLHDGIDRGGSVGGGSRFTYDMIYEVDGADESWVGNYWADNIAESTTGGELGSPVITQDMVDEASSDKFNRYTLPNGTVLWFVTSDRIGLAYKDGIDNNGDGEIDERIDIGIDDAAEVWFDGVDNDGDGFIDEQDEVGTSWLNRFNSRKGGTTLATIFTNADSTWTIIDSAHGRGFGDYMYDSNGDIVFDTNDNGIFNDNWGTDGKDNDGDWGLYVDDNGSPFNVPEENFVDLNGTELFESDASEIFLDSDGDGIWDPAEPFTDTNNNGTWDEGEPYTDLNNNGSWTSQELLFDYGLDRSDGTGDIGEGNGVWDGETFTDLNGNNNWDQFKYNDLDGNNAPSPGEMGVDEQDERDFSVNYGKLSSIYKDANDDGINDFPDFNVRNLRYDIRMDWEPNTDFTAIFSHGYAWARNINITGIARYLADGWIYRYYQSRMRWKNFFLQTYWNSSYSGDPSHPTRNMANGSIIYDRSKKFSIQFQHANEWKNGDIRFVWGWDYFLTMPDTRGTILSDLNGTDRKDNTGNGEAGSPYIFADRNDNGWVDIGENYSRWSTVGGTSTGSILDSIGLDAAGNIIYEDAVLGAISDGLDNDGDSDDYNDLNENGVPDYVDSNGNGTFELGETVEPGVQWLGGQRFLVYADGKDNNNNGKIDENIDEGIDEKSEDNRYNVNELGTYYQLNWKLNDKLEFIQATRLDAHDRLTDFVKFNNYNYGDGYSPLNWDFNLDNTDGLQISPKIGLVYKPKENQNFRLTWAKAFNTPSNQALFLDIYVARVSIFKVYARGADGGYVFPRDSLSSPYYFDITSFNYETVDTSESIFFYPSTDPRISGFYGQSVMDLPEIEAENVTSWEFGYKGRLNKRIFGTIDLYTSHYTSFVSPVTFITPIVIEKWVLEKDYNNDGIMNTINDLENNIINDQEDYDESFDYWRSGIQGVTAMDTIPGYSPPVVVGYINYGEVDMWGTDASLTYFINREWTLDLTYSHLGLTEFYNPITKNKDPINAPRNKAGFKLQYNPRRWPITGSLNARYVGGFNWSSGIYYGAIDPYIIYDFHAGYEINKYAKINLTVNNLFNHFHTEIIGGPSLGRIVLFRLQTKF
tara:strand:- start:5574 stop:9770 length:4197 start_codon:yes stop_codon:yes gene_type:complete